MCSWDPATIPIGQLSYVEPVSQDAFHSVLREEAIALIPGRTVTSGVQGYGYLSVTFAGVMRVEFSGPEIKVYFDEVLKISTTTALNQNDVEIGLVKATTGGSRFSEWDVLSFVNGGEITSNSGVQIVVTTPPGPLGLVDVVVTNPGGETTVPDGYTYTAGGGTAALLQLQRELLL